MTSEALWLKGQHPDHDAFVIEVLVRKNRLTGQLSSQRRLQSDLDEQVASTLPSGGMAEGAWALLAESARTEMTLQLLVKLSNDASFLEIFTGEADLPEEIHEKLTRDTMDLVQKELREVLPQIAREVTRTIHDGLRSKTE